MNKLLIHTIEQPESDTTTFVLSCDRLEVLDKTLKSFLETRDYITKMVIVDDSAQPGVFETLVERYGDISDVVCFPKNRSQWWAMDFMVSYCDSEYIFYLEDDWELLKPGYLNQSKEILQKYRNIGTVDISWRTFENEGFECYEKELIDNQFYWKKPWRISDYHLHWYGWIGSPNLKRRDDLILLGRVEKWHNEWNIDRRFLALGFKSVFLNGEYARHLGDNCSRMAGKRPNDGTTPEDYYPAELQADRLWPKMNYMFLDNHWRSPWGVTMVTAMLNISRGDRSFEVHYLEGMKKVLQCRNPMVVFAEEKYHNFIKEHRGTLPLVLKNLQIEDLENTDYFQSIQNIITKDEWINQAEWMKTSVIKDKYYIPLTLYKNQLLESVAKENPFGYNGSYKFYWIDSGMCNSYGINEHIDIFNFNKLSEKAFFLTSFDYYTDTEIHGYNIKAMEQICGRKPNYVCRATIFGGRLEHIVQFNQKFNEYLYESLNQGNIGTEESIFTIVEMKHPELVDRFAMPYGDIKLYLNTIRSRK